MGSAPILKISAKNDFPIALVAGGAGYLGSRLCRWLLRKKTQVICLDNLRSKESKNITELIEDKNFHTLDADFNQPLPKLEDVDYIFHLIGIDEYLSGKKLTLATLQANSIGTQNLLELARENKSKFLFGSFIETYTTSPFSAKTATNLTEQQKIYSHQEVKRFSESLAAEYYKEYNLNCRIVRFTDIYGPGMNFEAQTAIASLFKMAKEKEALIVGEEGLETIYPTFVEDAVEGIARALFLSSTVGKIYNLFGEKTTILKFAQTLSQTSGKKLEVGFKKLESEPRFSLTSDQYKSQEELGWKPKITIEEGIKETLGETPAKIEEKVPFIPSLGSDLLETESVFFKPTRFLKLLSALVILGLALFFPALSIGWDIFWGQRNLSFLEKEIASISAEAAFKKAESAESYFLSGQEKLADLNWLFEVTSQEETRKGWSAKMELAEKIARGAKELAKAGQTLEKVKENILGGGEVTRQDIEQGKLAIAAVLESWGESEAKLKASADPQEKKWAEQLSAWRQTLEASKDWLEILPQLIALDSSKTYLLLFQNNMELRPTGGFWGSFGLVTFENGKMAELKIEDIYTADGQLKGHVEPPDPIKKYLGKEHWFLRDANWNPDFPQSAQKAQWFLEKEIGVRTDGVLAFDLNLVQDLLGVLGPLEIADYKETVTSQDLFEKTEKYVEEDFFPGSTQKRDFLSSLSKSLIEKIKSGEGNKLTLAKVLKKSLEERHLMAYFNDLALEQKVLGRGGGGIIERLPCQGESSCFGDYLMVVDANLGINKANYWVKREIRDNINLFEDGSLSHRVSITYKNSTGDDSRLGGSYKNYLRIYAPPGVLLDEITVGSIATKSADLVVEAGKTNFGVYLEVPPKSEKEVVIAYHQIEKFEPDTSEYRLLFQKQAGTKAEPLILTVSYPVLWQINNTSGISLTRKGNLEYNGSLQSDKEFKFSFSK